MQRAPNAHKHAASTANTHQVHTKCRRVSTYALCMKIRYNWDVRGNERAHISLVACVHIQLHQDKWYLENGLDGFLAGTSLEGGRWHGKKKKG